MCSVISLRLVVLLLPHAIGNLKTSTCSLQPPEFEHYYHEGDLMIGGIISVMGSTMKMKLTFDRKPIGNLLECRQMNLRTYQHCLAFVFAIEEVNRNPHLLPNISLGFKVIDPCFWESRALLGMFDILSGKDNIILNYRCGHIPDLIGFVDGISSKISGMLARIFGLFNIPQISYSTMDSLLSHNIQFPSFYRTVPNENVQFQAIAKLIQYFGWSWIGIFVPDNESGLKASQALQKELALGNACVAFLEFIPSDMSFDGRKKMRIVKTLRSTLANVIIAYMDKDYIFTLQIIFYSCPIPEKVWILSSQWEVSVEFDLHFLSFSPFNGSLAFVIPTKDMSKLSEFIENVHPESYPNDIFIERACNELFECVSDCGVYKSRKFCAGNETITDSQYNHIYKEISSYSYSLYNAVYAFVYALHNMQSHMKMEQGEKWDQKAWTMHKYLKKISFTNNVGGVVQFDEHGDMHSGFDIWNWIVFPNESLHGVQIGQLETSFSNQLLINETIIRWSPGFNQTPRSTCSETCRPGYRKSLKEEHVSCCYECVPCSEGEISNDTNMDLCSKCHNSEFPNEENVICIPKVITYLSYEEPLGKCLVLLSILLFLLTCSVTITFINYRNTPVVKANNRDLSYVLLISLKMCFLCPLLFIGLPTNVTCLLRQPVFGITFSIAVSSILAKTIVVFTAFSATRPGSRLNQWIRSRWTNCIVLYCTMFQVVICALLLVRSPPFPYYNMEDNIAKILVECKEGTCLYCILGYMGFLAAGSFIIAFLARNLPDIFNEAKFITFSMLVFCSVWMSFIPAYLSSKGKYVVAVEIFAILTSSAGLLILIFVPKCYIILIRSDQNAIKQLKINN